MSDHKTGEPGAKLGKCVPPPRPVNKTATAYITLQQLCQSKHQQANKTSILSYIHGYNINVLQQTDEYQCSQMHSNTTVNTYIGTQWSQFQNVSHC